MASHRAISGSAGAITPAQESRSLAPYIVLVGIGLWILFGLAYEIQPLSVRLAASLVIITAALPLIRWHYRTLPTLPMFEMICISYGVHFGVAALIQPNSVRVIYGDVPLPWASLTTALLYVEIGLVAFISSYYMAARSTFFKQLAPINIPLSRQRTGRYIGLAILTGLVLEYADVFNVRLGPFGAFLFLGRLQMNLALTVWAFDYYSRSRRRSEEVYLIGVMGIIAGTGLLSGMLESALVPLFLVFAARWTATKHLPITWIVGGILLFLLFNQVKFAYRSETWNSTHSYTISGRLDLWRDLTQQSIRQYSGESYDTNASDLVRQNLARFDLIHRFTWVVTQTPSYVPYFGGETYSYFLVGWIPRFLWPDKPLASDALNVVDLSYGFKLPEQVGTTMIGIGQLPESFANFGIFGLFVIMAVQGFTLSFLNTLFNRPYSEGGRAVYLNLMVFFINGIGTATTMMFGALAQQLLANAVILRLGAGASPNSSPPAKRFAIAHTPYNH